MPQVSRRDFLKLAAAGAAGATVLPQFAGLAQDDVIEIEFMNWWGASREELMNNVIAAFEAENPGIKIINQVQPWDNREQLVATAVSSQTPPGLIMTRRVELYQFASQGLLSPVDSYVEASGLDVYDIFYEGEVNNQFWNGQLYTMPMPTAGGTTGLYFYNKKLVEAAGFDPETPPATWQEYEDWTRGMHKGDAFGVEVMGADPGTSAIAFISWLYTNDGTYISDDAKTLTFNDEKGVETLNWMVNFVNDVIGGIENTTDFYPGLTGADADHPFFNDELGIWHINTSAFNHLNVARPDVYSDTSAWGVGLRPANGNREGAVHQGVSGLEHSWGYVIPAAHSQEVQDAAYKFLEFLATNEQGGCEFLFAQLRPSPVKACNDNPAYFDDNPYWEVVLEALAADVSVPVTPVTTRIVDALDLKVEEAFFGVKSVEDALNEAAEEGQAILDEYWSQA